MELTEERIDELHELGMEDARSTGGILNSTLPDRHLTEEEREIYDYAFRNEFSRQDGY